MEKKKMETPDMTAKNVEKIGTLFPNYITESSDENGQLKKVMLLTATSPYWRR